jgi:DNA (cytosine-5)-methyltransferase 1
VDVQSSRGARPVDLAVGTQVIDTTTSQEHAKGLLATLGPPRAQRNGFIDIELFAGAGGSALGLSAAGIPPDHLFENDRYCCETLRHNAAGASPTITGEIHKEDIERVDWTLFTQPVRLLSGGPPCQPFSLGGKHLAERDGRNLFPATLRAIRELRPAVVLLENVPGLMRYSFRPYLDYLARQLGCPALEPGLTEQWSEHDKRIQLFQASRDYTPAYLTQRWLLNAADYGVAQARLRVFFVAIRSDLCAVSAPTTSHSRAALVLEQSDGTYWRARNLPPKCRESWPRRVQRPAAEDQAYRRPWKTVRDALCGLPSPSTEDFEGKNHWLIPGARLYRRHTGSELDWPAKTIKAGAHGTSGGENVLLLDDGTFRYFTLREMARIQGFPDDYVFLGPRSRMIRQIGNAAPAELVRLLGEQLIPVLSEFARAFCCVSSNADRYVSIADG